MLKKCVSVTPVQGSICAITKKPITTLLLEYPRTIHAELLTHRVFSKNSASTRAVPTKTAIDNANRNPAQYLWTRNQPGMQGEIITDAATLAKAELLYNSGLENISAIVALLGLPEEEGGLNIHKQHACRLLEPFTNMRTLLTSTEWTNFDWLRIDKAAFPEFEALAKEMEYARKHMEYMELNAGEYHIPFVERARTRNGKLHYAHPDYEMLSLEEAINLSLSLNAQTSFRKNDASEEKTTKVINQLFGDTKVHASPSEHIATPFSSNYHAVAESVPASMISQSQYPGLTAVDLNGNLRSGNFVNWLQYRQLIPNHDKAQF